MFLSKVKWKTIRRESSVEQELETHGEEWKCPRVLHWEEWARSAPQGPRLRHVWSVSCFQKLRACFASDSERCRASALGSRLLAEGCLTNTFIWEIQTSGTAVVLQTRVKQVWL